MAPVDLAADRSVMEPAAERSLERLWALAPAAGPALAIVLGALLSWRRPLTTDEAATLAGARGPFGDAVERALEHDPAQAGFVALANVVQRLGDAEWLVRAPGVLAAALAAFFVWWTGTMLAGRVAGLAASALLATGATVVEASQLARPPVQAVGAIALTTAILVAAIRCDRVHWWVLYALSATLLPLSHPVAASALLAHGATLVAARHELRLRLALPAFAFAVVETGLLTAAGAVDRSRAADGTGGLTLRELGEGLAHGVGWNPLLVALAVTGVVALATGRLAPAPRWAAVLTGGLAVAPVVALLAAAAFVPVWPEQALIACMPGVALAAGAAVAWIPVRWAGISAAAAAALVSVGLAVPWYARAPAEDWRAAARIVGDRIAAGETVVVLPERSRAAFGRYAPDVTLHARAYGGGAWIVLRTDTGADPVALARRVVRTPRYALLSQRPAGDAIVVQHWVRP
jgi:mannosyltransferase